MNLKAVCARPLSPLLAVLACIVTGPLASSSQTVLSYDASGHLQTIGPGSNSLPVIVGQPGSAVAPISANIFFSVSAIGSPPLTYQWQFNSNNISGANGDSLVLTNLTAGRFGAYRVVVSN